MFIQILQVVFVIYLVLFCHTSCLSNPPLVFPLASSFLCQLLMSPCEVRLVSMFCFFALFLCHVSVSPQLSVALSAQSCLHLGCVLFPKSVVSMFVLYPIPVSRSFVLVMVSVVSVNYVNSLSPCALCCSRSLTFCVPRSHLPPASG